MDKSTKRKLVAGAVGALALAVAVGAAGAIAATRALSGDESQVAAFDGDVPRLQEDFDFGQPRDDFGGPELFGNPSFLMPSIFGGFDAAATYLGLDEEELLDELREGKTLAEVAEEQDKPVAGLIDAMTAAAEERIDEAVESGRLDEDEAAELKADLEETIRDFVEGELMAGQPFGNPGFGPEGFDGDRERGPEA